MAKCSQCGKKGFFLFYQDGLCRECFEKKQKEEARALEQKKAEQQREEEEHKQKLQYALQIYSKLIMHYQKSKVSLATCTIDDLSAAVTEGARFCDLLAKSVSIPLFIDAFMQDSSNHETFILNNVFGYIKVREDRTICLDGIRDGVEKDCKKYREIIHKSAEFEHLIATLPTADFPAETSPLFPPSTNFPQMEDSNITKRTKYSAVNSYYVLDTETTGLSITTAEVIQISAIRFMNFQPVEALTSYVHPKHGLNADAQKINQITEEDVKGAPEIDQILPAFDAYLAPGVPIVGHNLGFDYNFLRANGSRVMRENLTKERKFFDTLELSKREYKDSTKYSLDYLCRTELGIIRSTAHNSLSDALATGLLFAAICQSRMEASDS